MLSPNVCVEVIVFNYGGALLVNENMQSEGACWRFPSAMQHQGETLQQATVRAVKDACGIDVEPGKVLNAYDQMAEGDETSHCVVLDMEGYYVDGEFDCDNETRMAAWASSYALKTMEVDRGTLAILNKLGFIDWC